MWRTIALGLVAMGRVASADGWGSAGSAGGSAQQLAPPGGERHGLGILFVAIVVLGLLVLSKYLPSTKRQAKQRPDEP